MTVVVHHGDCRDVLATLDAESVDAIVTDPPYELGFMGKKWDAAGVAYDVTLWRQALRGLKPGGHLLAFGGTRTYHRMTAAIEDAGFEVRDSIHWLYGSGFPKSLDVSKAIDKRGGFPHLAAEIGAALKAARKGRGVSVTQADRMFCDGTTNWTWFEGRPKGQRAPTPTTFARIVAEWPELADLSDRVAEAEREVVGVKSSGIADKDEGPRHTIGASQAVVVPITAPATDAAKEWAGWGTALKPAHEPIVVARKPLAGTVAETVLTHRTGALNIDATKAQGRWPANVVIDDHIAERHPEWSHYYYCAKPSTAERNAGLDGRNLHPTVKPLALMRWLVRLVTPPGGLIVEPFAGSGTTLAAAVLEGFDAIGIEMTDDYLPIIHARIAWAEQQADATPPTLFDEGDAA